MRQWEVASLGIHVYSCAPRIKRPMRPVWYTPATGAETGVSNPLGADRNNAVQVHAIKEKA